MNAMTISDLFHKAGNLENAGDITGAVETYKTWIALHSADPHIHAAYFNYAVVQSRSGDRSGAINTLREAIRIKPDFHPPYINLGRLLEDIGQAGTAVAQWLELVRQLSPFNGETLKHKLMVLQQIGRVLENNHVDEPAEDALRQSIELRPEQPEVVQHWIALRQKQCKWPVIEGWDGVSTQALLANISPLSAAVMFDDPMFQLARAYSYAKQAITMPAGDATDHAKRRGTRRNRLKIGYVSSDLREHAVGFGLSEVMELHDRNRFEIHAYYCGIGREDPTKVRIRSAVDSWVDISALDDDQAAHRISADGIDILIDVNGYTRDARTAVFARKPAPIQANWYGFPGTMGTPYHHYIIADSHVIPEEHEIYFSEKVLRLPCYQPNDRRRTVSDVTPSRREENLPDEGFVFCCLNGSQKCTETMFAAWLDILGSVPGSVLWLLDSNPATMNRLRQNAAASGVAPERLCFAPKRPNPLHLARYRHANLFLDTFPYGAHTTASDAMWMGVPVLTVPGRTFASRVCASLVSSVGLPDLICRSLEHYVSSAIAIGNDRMLAAQLKARTAAARNTCTLFNTAALVTGLEDLYDQMWEAFAGGRLPVPDLRNLDIYEAIAISLHAEGVATGPAEYRQRLRQLHGHAPIWPDARLWSRADSGPAVIPAFPDRGPQIRDRETPDPAWLQKAG